MIAAGPLGGPLKVYQAKNVQPDGSITITKLDGSTLTVLEDGTERTTEVTPPGTTGPWEKATPQTDGIVAFWHGLADSGQPQNRVNLWSIVETLPNG